LANNDETNNNLKQTRKKKESIDVNDNGDENARMTYNFSDHDRDKSLGRI